MAITTPNAPKKFKALEEDFATSIAQALWQKAAQDLNYINDSVPVGFVMFFVAGQLRLPAMPDPRFWAPMDGSTINNPNSPMNGVVLPDTRNKFFRHPNPSEGLYSLSGSDVIYLGHSHAGITAYANARAGFNCDGGGDHWEAFDWHAHGISGNLGYYTTVPPYYPLQLYVRIA